MLNSDLLIPVGYETSKYGYAPSRPADLMDGPLIARIRGRSRRYMRLAHVRRIHSNDREGVPMAKAGRLCILKKEMAPLLQVVTSYSSPELMELTLFLKGTLNIVREVRLDPLKEVICLGKMPRMAVSMGITGLSMNLLQMHVREECLHPYSRSRNAGYLAARSALSSAFSMYETLDLTKHVNPGGTEGSSGAGKADPSASTSQDASSRSERPLEVSQEELWTSVDRVRSERNVVLDSDWTSE
ncbi:hypothetical protein Tco_0268826 [Tanacetum coccineum]